MSKPKFTLRVLVSLFSLCLEVSIQAQPRETKPETATVSGLVTLKGEPARGVTVLLQNQQSYAANSPRARSDENGRFRITGVAAGKYSITALAPGYVSLGDSDMGREGQALNVAEGEKIENINFDIKRGGAIAGSVTDSRGRPVVEEAVNVELLDKNGKPRMYSPLNREMSLTDDRGAYRIFGLPEGRYLVSVGQDQSSGSAKISTGNVFYPRAYYTGVTGESEAKAVKVGEGSEVTNIDIRITELKRTYEISGRVVNADTGQPVAGVGIVIGLLTPDGKPRGWTNTGDRSSTNGEFRLTGVVPGKYSLFATTSTDVQIAASIAAGSGFICEPAIVNVEEDMDGVEIKVHEGASISGVAVIEGTNDPKILSKLSEVRFYASSHSGTLEIPTRSNGVGKVNPDGSFRIGGIQAGKVFLSMMWTQNSQDFVLGRIEHNGETPPNGIEMQAGQQVTGVRVVLIYSSLKLRGELKVIGLAAGGGPRFRILAHRGGLS